MFRQVDDRAHVKVCLLLLQVVRVWFCNRRQKEKRMTSGGQLGPDGQPLAPHTDDDDDDCDSQSTGSGVPMAHRSDFASSFSSSGLADNGTMSTDFMRTGSDMSAVEAALLHRAMACSLASSSQSQSPLGSVTDAGGPDTIHSSYGGSSSDIGWPGSAVARSSPFNRLVQFYPQSAAMLHPGPLTAGVTAQL